MCLGKIDKGMEVYVLTASEPVDVWLVISEMIDALRNGKVAESDDQLLRMVSEFCQVSLQSEIFFSCVG